MAHYIIGAIGLALGWVILMELLANVYVIFISWTLWYIVMDQLLHVIVKGEKINVIKVK